MQKISLFIAAALILLISCRQVLQKPAKSKVDSEFLEEISVSALQDGYKKGKYTVTDVVRAYLKRIDDLDKNGPRLNSVIIVNPDAIQQAEMLDKELAQGKIRGPLHGIPVILKDNIDTHDKMPCTGGSLALKNSFPMKDSWVAGKLKEAGAVIIAKSNLSEWANFRAQVSSSGWSGVGGQTKNPFILDRNPCGSSSGSAVAVSANLCALAIGTETNGSIVCPSNNNGIVGLKPTVGLISRSGIIPISFTQDTPGPMGRTVEDVAVCLGALTGIDPADPKTIGSEGKSFADYTRFLKVDGLKGKRIGLIKEDMGFHYKVDSLMKQTVQKLKQLGAEIVEISFPLDRSIDNASFQVLLYEFKDGLNAYFKRLGPDARVKNMNDLISFNQKDSVELADFDQKTLEMAAAKGDLKSSEYLKSIEIMQSGTRENGIDKIMAKYKLDVLMSPTGSPAWKTDLVDGDHFVGGNSSWAAISGYPSITVPMGFIDDLPVGVSFFGRAWSEPMLIEIAYAYEQNTHIRKAPKYIGWSR